jgi:hypothetical protein
MTDFSLQLQADNLPIDSIESLFVGGPWEPILARMMTAENLLVEGCRGVGKTMLMRAAAQRLQASFKEGGRTFGVHTTFKRYLATLPPPSTEISIDADLGNFRAWTNARILGAVRDAIQETSGSQMLEQLGELGAVDWTSVVSALETTYLGGFSDREVAASIGLPAHIIPSLQGYSYTSTLLNRVVQSLNLELLVLFLDDAAHALDTRAQGAFFTTIKSLYNPRLAFKISVYPAVTRYGIDFSYGHDAVVVPLGVPPRRETIDPFIDLLRKRLGVAEGNNSALIQTLLENRPWVELLIYCANGNPRGLLKLIAQVQTQLGGRTADAMRYEDIRVAINTVMDRHLDNMVPGVIKDLDPRLLKAARFLLDDFRSKIAERPGPYESGRPRGYLAITNSMQVPYLCQAAIKLLVAANVMVSEGPARLSKKETGTLYLLHPGFIFRDNVIGPYVRGTLTAGDWISFFSSLSSRVHAEIAKTAETWTEALSEIKSEPTGECQNGHPMLDPRGRCEVCGAPGVVVSPVKILLDKDIQVLEISDALKDRLRAKGFDSVRKLFEATDDEIDAVEYIGEKRTMLIRNAVSVAVDEFMAG